MAVVVASLVLLAVVSGFNLLLTFGLVRRLKAHTTLLSLLVDTDKLLPVGGSIPEFSATTPDGAPFDRDRLDGPAALAFLSVDCPHCRTSLPEFVAYVQGGNYPPEKVLAVVCADDDAASLGAADMVAALAPVANLVREPLAGGPVSQAFGVQVFPTFYLTGPGGVLAAGAHAVRNLPGARPHSTTQRRA